METLRTFICIPLPDEILCKVEQIQENVRQKEDGVKWVHPQSMHLTLQFLGDVKQTSVEEIGRMITPLIESTPAFFLSLEGAGAFPNFRRPKVLWLGIQDESGQLVTLQEQIAAQLSKLGFKEDKKYHPHLTLGRVKKPWLAQKVVDRLSDQKWELGSFSADRVLLMKSELLPQGAHHTCLIKIELRKH
ncbi:RNA 2',3'-cyclic phosphodiesterase [candidate division KSB1 bacterium]|jgi:2'-5' RNA ligase|nr:RNA 2',3'-cyclic phosphodiesterase [candidate division KSB1 bacterium]